MRECVRKETYDSEGIEWFCRREKRDMIPRECKKLFGGKKNVDGFFFFFFWGGGGGERRDPR